MALLEIIIIHLPFEINLYQNEFQSFLNSILVFCFLFAEK